MAEFPQDECLPAVNQEEQEIVSSCDTEFQKADQSENEGDDTFQDNESQQEENDRYEADCFNELDDESDSGDSPEYDNEESADSVDQICNAELSDVSEHLHNDHLSRLKDPESEERQLQDDCFSQIMDDSVPLPIYPPQRPEWLVDIFDNLGKVDDPNVGTEVEILDIPETLDFARRRTSAGYYRLKNSNNGNSCADKEQ